MRWMRGSQSMQYVCRDVGARTWEIAREDGRLYMVLYAEPELEGCALAECEAINLLQLSSGKSCETEMPR